MLRFIKALLPLFVLVTACPRAIAQDTYPAEVYAPEFRDYTDHRTGAAMRFLTTSPAHDINLYFHQRSCVPGVNVILFTSDRLNDAGDPIGLMGFIEATGELFSLRTPAGPLSGTTAARHEPALFALRGSEVLRLGLEIEPTQDVENTRSKVTVRERLLGVLPKNDGASNLAENANGEWLALGSTYWEHMKAPGILLVNVETGAFQDACAVDNPPGFGAHVQWSPGDPNLILFSGHKPRLWLLDIRASKPWNPYPEWAGELVTHEHFWKQDELVFCGGTHAEPMEDAHVKTLNVRSGEVRIIGAGAWWPTGDDQQIAKENHWHCAGSEDGRWVVADNWHGDISLFEGGTTRKRVLTYGHRTYGQGEHPHVGWHANSQGLLFGSHQRGNLDVVLAHIPKSWQEANPTPAISSKEETAP